MFFDQVQDNLNQNGFVTTFLGYNHNKVIADGEFYDMENMSSDNFPLLSPRKKRESVLQLPSEEYKTITITHETTADSDKVVHVVT